MVAVSLKKKKTDICRDRFISRTFHPMPLIFCAVTPAPQALTSTTIYILILLFMMNVDVFGWMFFFFAHYDLQVDRRPELREVKPRSARNKYSTSNHPCYQYYKFPIVPGPPPPFYAEKSKGVGYLA